MEMEDAEDEDSNKAKAASKTKGSDEVMYVGPYDSAPSTSRRGGYDGDDAGPSSRYRRPEGHEQNYGDRFHDRMTSNRDYD